MDQENADNAAYMALLNRNIPGVGGHPTGSPSPLRSSTLSNVSSEHSTPRQTLALAKLNAASHDLVFVSETETPFDFVQISPTADHALVVNSSPHMPDSTVFLQILNDSGLLSSLSPPPTSSGPSSLTHEWHSARATHQDLSSISTQSHPEPNALESTFRQIWPDPSSQLAIYRIVEDEETSTRVHLFILGWIDSHLVGLHTLAIES